MDSPTVAPETTFQTARIVWLAFLTAIGLYGVVLVLVVGDGAGGASLPQLRTLLTGLAIGSGVAAWAAFRRVARIEPAVGAAPIDEADLQRRLGFALLSWAFAESIALYGFVLAMLERRPSVAIAFFACGALALLAARPRPELFR